MSVTAEAITEKKYRLVNPTRGPKTGAKRAPRTARTTNPLYLLGPSINPHKGGHKTVAQKKKPAKKTPAARKNPFASARPLNMPKPKRRRNPEGGNVAGILTRPYEVLKFGLVALFGLVATRQAPQLAFGEKNESYLGYAANLATAVGGAYATGKFAGKTAGFAFGIGGGLYTANRILTDKFTPVGRVLSLAGIGDPQASKSLGRIVPGSVYPPSYDEQGNLKLPQNFVDAMQRRLPAAPAPALSGVRARLGNARIAA